SNSCDDGSDRDTSPNTYPVDHRSFPLLASTPSSCATSGCKAISDCQGISTCQAMPGCPVASVSGRTSAILLPLTHHSRHESTVYLGQGCRDRAHSRSTKITYLTC